MIRKFQLYHQLQDRMGFFLNDVTVWSVCSDKYARYPDFNTVSLPLPAFWRDVYSALAVVCSLFHTGESI